MKRLLFKAALTSKTFKREAVPRHGLLQAAVYFYMLRATSKLPITVVKALLSLFKTIKPLVKKPPGCEVLSFYTLEFCCQKLTMHCHFVYLRKINAKKIVE
jgi:hypothetical protein